MFGPPPCFILFPGGWLRNEIDLGCSRNLVMQEEHLRHRRLPLGQPGRVGHGKISELDKDEVKMGDESRRPRTWWLEKHQVRRHPGRNFKPLRGDSSLAARGAPFWRQPDFVGRYRPPALDHSKGHLCLRTRGAVGSDFEGGFKCRSPRRAGRWRVPPDLWWSNPGLTKRDHPGGRRPYPFWPTTGLRGSPALVAKDP